MRRIFSENSRRRAVTISWPYACQAIEAGVLDNSTASLARWLPVAATSDNMMMKKGYTLYVSGTTD